MKKVIKNLAFDERMRLGFEILSLSNVEVQSKQNLIAPHRASFYLIFWFQEGSPLHVVDFNAVAVKPDSFLFIRKDAVQFFDQERGFSSRVILFTEEFFCRSEGDHQLLEASPLFNDFGVGIPHLNITATPILKQVWSLIEEEALREPDDLQAPLLQKFLSSFLMLSEREIPTANERPTIAKNRVELAIAFKKQLEHGFRKEKSTNYYADKLFVSDKVLAHTLQSITGKSTKQLIIERIILEAKRLLIYNQDSAKSIALYLGFKEPTNFVKFFKKHTGTTPGKFQEKFKRSDKVGKVSS